jgi:hypothetical protein
LCIAENRIAGEFLEEAFLHHDVAATAAFFSRLENRMNSAVEITRFRQVLYRRQQHGGMAVVAAGVHLAGNFRGIRRIGFFMDIEGVDIGAQSDRTLRAALFAP